MPQVDERMSTGLPELDRVLKGLIPGDNVVWQVEDVEDYVPFVRPFCRHARRQEHRLVYFRFARHGPLAGPEDGAEVVELHPEEGFEQFIVQIHRVIKSVGRGGYYLFDCLSDLAVDWYSDQMLGNFFVLTCPYLYDVEAIAYFALIRNHHSLYATGPINETAQVVIDTLRHQGRLHVHPLKVQQRYSPTMHMVHAWQDGAFTPVTASARITEILASSAWRGLESATYRLDLTHRTFLAAEAALAAAQAGEAPPEKAQDFHLRLLRMAVTRDNRLLELARRWLDLSDLLTVGRRMIGTGLIGGKSLGMLLARAVLKRRDPGWTGLLEPHDSFFIGSDVSTPSSSPTACGRPSSSSATRPLSWRAPRPPAAASWSGPSQPPSSSSSPTCSTISASRPSSSAPPACWRTTTATPSPASMKASSASTRAPRPSGWRTSSPPCAPSTPAP